MTRNSWTTLALAVLALAVASAGWLVWREPTGSSIVPPRAASSHPSEAGTPEPALYSESNRAAVVDASVPTVEVVRRGRDDQQGPKTALVRVLVTYEDGTPVVGASASLMPAEAGSWTTSAAASSHAGIGENTKTANDGRCELEAQSDREHSLSVSFGEHGLETRNVPAIAAGAELEITVELLRAETHQELDLDFFGIVVDDETGKPIVGASIRCECERTDLQTSTGAFGIFMMRAASWDDFGASAVADGYARRLFRLGSDHETQAQALVVRLSRSATLHVTVVDATGAGFSGAGVSATADSDEIMQRESSLDRIHVAVYDPTWRTMSDASGAAVLSELPPGVPLTVTAYRGALQAKALRPLELEPGEVRSLELRLGGGARIRGSLVDADGRALTGQLIWCVPVSDESPDTLRDWQEHDVRARAITDEHGKFELHDLPAGTWSLGPAPSEVQSRVVRDAAILSLVQSVVVDSSVDEIDVVMVGQRGEFIGGRVVDPNGNPVGRVLVFAHSSGPSRYGISAEADATGAFVLGPLPSGRYEVGAFHQLGFADSASVTAGTGATDIVLQLRAASRVRGFVVDAATGEHREAEIFYGYADAGWDSGGQTIARDGNLELDGLLPGAYNIVAKTRDSQFGSLAGLLVRSGEMIDDVRILVSPGGTLRLRYDGPEEKAGYRVLVHGRYLAGGTTIRGEATQIAVPAETLAVSVRGEEKEVPVSAGKTVEVTFGAR